jgi:hypothetical protein
MAEHDLRAVAFPRLGDARLAALPSVDTGRPFS